MAWFRQKGIYWHYCYRKDGKEIQVYIGTDEQILARLLPNPKKEKPRKESQRSKRAPRGKRTGPPRAARSQRALLLPKKKGVRK